MLAWFFGAENGMKHMPDRTKSVVLTMPPVRDSFLLLCSRFILVLCCLLPCGDGLPPPNIF